MTRNNKDEAPGVQLGLLTQKLVDQYFMFICTCVCGTGGSLTD